MAVPAGASGPPVERFDGIYLTCDGLGEVFIVTLPANGDFTPGLVLDSNAVLVPYEFHNSFTFTPTGGEPQTESEDLVKRAPMQATLDRCVGRGEFSDDAGTYVFNVEALQTVTPSRRRWVDANRARPTPFRPGQRCSMDERRRVAPATAGPTASVALTLC
ncbi:MAG: hypothetical protein ACKOYM_09825 [Actinomycetes bacterium]